MLSPLRCRHCDALFYSHVERHTHEQKHKYADGKVPARENVSTCQFCGKVYKGERER